MSVREELNQILTTSFDHDSPLETLGGESGSSEVDRLDDRFVPIHPLDLRELLLSEFADKRVAGCSIVESLEQVFGTISSRIEAESTQFHATAERLYLGLDPDRDTLDISLLRLPGELESESEASVNAQPTSAQIEEVTTQFGFLLDKANFEQLNDVQIRQLIQKARSKRMSVRVEEEAIDFLQVWVRGRGTVPKWRWTWKRPIRGEEFPEDVFRRMVIVAKLKEDRHLMLKMFKDIPETDVEALLPHAQATMTLLDRIALIGSSAGTLGTMIAKLAGIAFSIAALSKLLWILLVGLGTIAFKTVFGYHNVRKNRRGQRVRHLYFQNLANNASVVHRIVSMVKQEELKEAYLAYAFGRLFEGQVDDQQCLTLAVSRDGLCQAIEDFLQRRVGRQVDFDIDDAIDTLQRLQLLSVD